MGTAGDGSFQRSSRDAWSRRWSWAGCRAIRRPRVSKLSVAKRGALGRSEFNTTGEIWPAAFRRRPPLPPNRGASRLSSGLIRRRPDITLLRDRRSSLIANSGERFAGSVLWRFFDRHQITFKKNGACRGTTTRGRAKSTPGMVRGQLDLDPTKLVFIDETGASTNLARKSGRCRRGRRLRSAISHSHYKTVTLVAGLRLRGLTAARTFRRTDQRRPVRGLGRRHASSPRSRPARPSSWTISPLTRGRGSSN